MSSFSDFDILSMADSIASSIDGHRRIADLSFDACQNGKIFAVLDFFRLGSRTRECSLRIAKEQYEEIKRKRDTVSLRNIIKVKILTGDDK